ncbi:MAG: hypothetical protein ACLUVM_08550 [Blautia faecis]
MITQGKIAKDIAGFYYVYAEDGNTYEYAGRKGNFPKDKLKPLVGDNVDITVLDEGGVGRQCDGHSSPAAEFSYPSGCGQCRSGTGDLCHG